MIQKSLLNKLLALVMGVALLSSCKANSAGTVPTATLTTPVMTSTPASALPVVTMTPTENQDLANTQAAQTANANATLNAPTSTPVPPSETPPATSTPTPTFTLLPTTAVPTATLYPYTLTPSNTPTGYACQITSTSPAAYQPIKVNTDFEYTWVIKNTGIKLWGHANADLKYVSGEAMQTKGSLFDFTQDVRQGESYTATVAMHSPSKAATYTATWEIIQDSVLVCTLDLKVLVTN